MVLSGRTTSIEENSARNTPANRNFGDGQVGALNGLSSSQKKARGRVRGKGGNFSRANWPQLQQNGTELVGQRTEGTELVGQRTEGTESVGQRDRQQWDSSGTAGGIRLP